MNIKFQLILLIFAVSSFRAIGSTPQPCDGGEEEIHNMLQLLASSARDYYVENKKLPGMWSRDMANIINRVPNAYSFGNITSASGHKIKISCAVKKEEVKYNYFYYFIDMRNLEISHDAIFQQ